jgi:ATP-dependent helicase HepA
VLLADEVGLGKTIEAGMIVARQLAAGRAGRVLVLLPETLVYQWFVELLRRFNLPFAIFDEERCEAIEQGNDGHNPFDDEQLVIADFAFLESSPKRAQQLADAGWDLIVVDEAHHLEWTPEAASPRYQLVETLATATPGVILLTATPEQLGRAGHFARLRLLDPQRYSDLDAYLAESAEYGALSEVATTLADDKPLSADQRRLLTARFKGDRELAGLLMRDDANAELLAALIDRHGTGRAMFRNRRAGIGGFPRRVPEILAIDPDTLDAGRRDALLAEFRADIQGNPVTLEFDYNDDPRLTALIDLLDDHPADKFLLICRSQAKVLAIEDALRTKSGVGVARFHEGLGIVQRDRNAAFFAQPDGARLLLCSEIGSEGRNFQFAHRLVMWDLPLDPDLLEQRIGRLDRIGQKHDITVHVPVVEQSAQHVLARWYDEGLDAFRSSPADGRELLRRFGPLLSTLADEHAREDDARDQELDALIAETRGAHEELSALILAGRDHLLELAASRDPHADDLAGSFAREDIDPARDAFIQRLFETYGVHAEELATDIVMLDPQYLSTDGLPGFADGPLSVTFSRDIALAREDLPLLRLDHPMVHAAVDLLVSGEEGNAAFLVDDALPVRTALLQTVYVLEIVADRALDAGRFLPATPLVVSVDTRLSERPGFRPSDVALRRAPDRNIEVARFRKFLAKLVPPMLEHALDLAEGRAELLKYEAIDAAKLALDTEHARLVALRTVNPSIAVTEVEAIAAERNALLAAIPEARLRLDAVRFVVSPDFLSLR